MDVEVKEGWWIAMGVGKMKGREDGVKREGEEEGDALEWGKVDR